MWKVGSLQVVRVLEVELPVPRELLAVGEDPEALLATSPWAVPALANEEGQVYFSLSAICVESQGRKIVIDPWISFDQRRGQPDAAEQAERQLASLGEVGFAPGDVDVVVSTHIDGIGWSTRPEGSAWVPSFPKARYVWTASEVERVLSDDDGDAASLAPLLEAGRVDRVEAPHAITSEVRLEAAPGHTPGNVNVWIESDGEAAVVTGDLILHPLQMVDPDWAGLDMEGESAAASRRVLLADAEKRGALVIGPHFPSPGAFRVAADGGTWRPLDVPTTR